MSFERTFRGVLVPCVTPFVAEDPSRLDLPRLDLLVDFLLDQQRADGIIALGTTGESTALSHKEKLVVTERVVRRVDGRVPVLIGTGSANTRDTIALTAEMTALGADGALVVAPYYVRPDQAGLIRHFTEIAESSNIPLVIYNIPIRTGVNILPTTLMRLCQIPTVVGVKDCYGDLAQTSELLRLRRESSQPFTVLTGEDQNFFLSLCLGGDGAVAATAHVLGAQLRQILDLFDAGELSAARDLQFAISELQRALFAAPNPAPIKSALDLTVPRLGGPVRSPLVEAPAELKERIAILLSASSPTVSGTVG